MEPKSNRKDVILNEFRFVGMSRSGNHAIINWVISQLNGTYCFLNCAEPKHNPFTSARPLGVEANIYKTNIPSFNLLQEQQGDFSAKDYLLYSHEDCFLGSLNHPVYKKNRDRWLGQAAVKRNILILRDPFNLFSSRIKSGLIIGHYTHHGTRPISIPILKRIYKQHAREFLERKKYLDNRVLINFNNWAADKDYRKSIADTLQIPFTDKGFKEVSYVAGGSSFDGTNLSGRANKMDLHNRWKEFARDDFFWSMFDAELIELTQEIFDITPPITFLKENSIF